MNQGWIDRRRFMQSAVSVVAAAAVAPPESGRAAAIPAADRHADGIELRSFASSDAAPLARLVEDNYGGDEARISSLLDINRALHLSSGTGKVWHRTLVAESAGQVIGVASAMRSPMHPAARVHVLVAEEHRRRGLGSRLYQRLAEQVRMQALLPTASIIGAERTAWPFASACGMRPLMHARQIRVDPESWASQLWCKSILAANSEFRLLTGPAVESESLFLAIGGAYYEMHRRWIETAKPDATSARRTWEGKIAPSEAVVALRGDDVVGAAALINMGNGRATLFPAAACKPIVDLALERRLVAALLADRLSAARAAGHTEVLIESDEDDGRMLEVHGAIPAFGLIEIFTLTAGAASFWPRA